MVTGINVDITIRDTLTGEYLRIPVLPEKVAYKDGEALADTVKILNLGNIDFLNGVELDSMGWTSFFPARYDPGYCSVTDILPPLNYRNTLSGWKDAHTVLQVICSAAGINKTMTLRAFTWELTGFEGDIDYSVEFKEHKSISPRQLTVGGAAAPVDKLTPVDRQPVPEQEKPAAYTIKAGDTLIHVAKSLGITDWYNDLYLPNKAVIGTNPGLILPGQVLAV